MARVMLLLIAITITISGHYHVVEGTPVSELKNIADVQTFGGPRMIAKNGRFIPDLPISWSLPTFPTISVSSLFKNDDKELTAITKRVDSLEKSHRRILELLKKLNEALKINDKETTPTQHQKIDETNTTTHSEVPAQNPNGTEIVNIESDIVSQINPENEYSSGPVFSIDPDDDKQHKLVIIQNKTERLDQHVLTFGSSENMGGDENKTITETNKNEGKLPVIELGNETGNLTIPLTQELEPDDVPSATTSKPSNIVPQIQITFENGHDRKLRFPDF